MRCDTPMTLKEVKEMLGIVDRQPIPMTNEEYLKSCNTEQLAEWIKCHMNCNFCPMRLKCEDMRDCMEHIKAWLKQSHTPIS